MRFATLSESEADEAAVRILAEGIATVPVTWEAPARLRPGGWPAVREQLPTVIRHLHYHAEPAAALIVVVDTNDSPLHEAAHAGTPPLECRWCTLRRITERTLADLTPIAGRPTIHVVIGAATPAIEAWYLCGKNPNPSEQTWAGGGARGYDRQSLKRTAYGSDRASLARMTEVATMEATRLATNLGLLRAHFPRGFGALETGILAL
jgi:hypothetical protein